MKNKKGFTLIELLVVIAIIGLLSTLAVISLSAARARARDAKRIADLRNIQSALELYASEKGTYPIVQDTNGVELNGGCIDADSGVVGLSGRTEKCGHPLMEIPKDPVNKNFIYKSNSDGTSYTIFVPLEAKKGACATPGKVEENVDACPQI